MKDKLIKVGISIGDMNGIGLEIILKTFEDHQILELCTPIIFASNKLVSFQKKHFNTMANFQGIDSVDAAIEGKLNVLNCWKETPTVTFGQETEEGGKYAFLSLQAAVEALKNNEIDVLVTAPINKNNIQSDNFHFPGHTDYLAKELNGTSLMFMVSEDLKVGLLTDHVPLKNVSSLITESLIMEKARLMNESLIKDFRLQRPKIAVLGINPHCGDKGVIGNEDDDATAGFNVGNISPSRGTLLANALVQPLDFVSGLSPKWPGLSLRTYYKRKNNTSAYVTVETLPNPQSYPENTTLVRDFSSILGSQPVQPGGKNVLGPGQTIVLLSSRYAKSSVAMNKSNRGIINGVPYLFQTLTRAIEQGYCRYVVALDNGKVKGEDEAYSPNTGTMNFYGFDIPLLVKKSNRKSSQANRIVDGAWYIRNFYNAIGRYIWTTTSPAQLRQIFPPYVFNQPNLTNSGYLYATSFYLNAGSLILNRDNFGVDQQSRLNQAYDPYRYMRLW